MANIKSKVKRIRTNELARLRNQSVKSSLRTAVRSFREAAEAGDKEKAAELLRVDQPQAGQGRQQGRHPQEPGGEQEVRAGARPQQDLIALQRLVGRRSSATFRTAASSA